MRIVDMLSEDLIISDLLGQTRDEVLSEMVGCIVARHSEVDAGQALSVLLDRERIGSTGIGEGLAIPHARVHTLTHPVACLARSAQGVDFRALDGKPTHLFLTLLAPSGAAGFHLKALARASRMLKDPAFRRDLLEGRDAHAMWETLVVKDESLSTPV